VRVQVNHDAPDLGAISRYAQSKGVQAIAQSRDPERFPDDRRISWLYDASGGRGVAPVRRPVRGGAGQPAFAAALCRRGAAPGGGPPPAPSPGRHRRRAPPWRRGGPGQPSARR
jgi:hypothetical protein